MMRPGITSISCVSIWIFHLSRLEQMDTKLHVFRLRKELLSVINALIVSRSKVFPSAPFARGQRNWFTVSFGPKLSLRGFMARKTKLHRTSLKTSLKSLIWLVRQMTKFSSPKSSSTDFSTRSLNTYWPHLEIGSPKASKKFQRKRRMRHKSF